MASYVRKEKLMRGLMIYQRDRSPYWYARIKRPERVGDKKTSGYRNVSLKITDLEEAKRLAFAAYEAQVAAPSSSSPDFGWDSLWERYLRERHSNRPTLEAFWKRYLRRYISEKKISSVEDFNLSYFREFMEWRRDYWDNHPDEVKSAPLNIARKPRQSTLKENMTMANTILTALYSYVDKPRPDFTTVNRQFASRLARTAHRTKKTRGFALTPEHYEEIRREMKLWAFDDSAYNIHHRYARERLYYAMTLTYLTRARPGTELKNIRRRDLDWNNFGNVSTYRIETTGKVGARTLLMEQDNESNTKQNNAFRHWAEGLDIRFPNLHFDDPNAFLFAGSVKNKIDGRQQLQGNRLNQLFKAFLRRPQCEHIRYHPSSVTGRDDANAVEVCLYDIRTTAISHFITRRGSRLNKFEMARLCGVGITTMDYYYLYFDEMRNAEKWLGLLPDGSEDIEERRARAKVVGDFTEKLMEVQRAAHELQQHELDDARRLADVAQVPDNRDS